ncbi:MobH family relaxase [Herbaspirillum sp. ST 5-3]|uniref:MobH family relaxase n=1 Tax=Oxalobacteraceae TaxID=75682 RepID=UPI0010A2F78A|nr:MobH family relaxase [Herbaspirillum sp. ST 5-3]
MVFGSLFSGRRSAGHDTPGTRNEAATPAPDATAPLTYPPLDPGFPTHSVDDILSVHSDLIRRIKLAYGADHETYSNDLETVMHRYAGYVNLLPATANNYFSGPGGLLRMGLEIAFYSLQATDGQIFSGRSTITNRRQLEPRWRHATFIAGLCSQIHRTLSHVLVTDDKGNAWPAYLGPLTDWLQGQRSHRFFVRWIAQAQETRTLGVFSLPHIIPAETLQLLAHGNSIIVPHMMASISGMPIYRDHNILDQLVRHATALVIDRDLQASTDRTGKPQLGSHLARYLIDALRRLVQCDSAWAPNADKSRIWYGQDGLFVVWPNAAAEITGLLETDRLPGIPKSPATILDILADAEVIAPRNPSQTTWPIYPPGVMGPIEAVKLASPNLVLAHLAAAPSPLPIDLLAPRAMPGPASSTHQRASTQLSLLEPKSDFNDVISQQESNEQNKAPSVIDIAKRPRADQDWPDAAITVPTTFSFNAPLRLNPAVRSALTDIVDTLNGHGAYACCRVPAGLFVPLAELERRQIDTSMAIRTLSDLEMLVSHPPGKVKTVTHDFGGNKVLGIVITPQHISGFDPSDFAAPSPATGSSHAGPQI